MGEEPPFFRFDPHGTIHVPCNYTDPGRGEHVGVLRSPDADLIHDDCVFNGGIWIRDILQKAIPSFRAIRTDTATPRRSIPKVDSYRPSAP